MLLFDKDNPETRKFWQETSFNTAKWCLGWAIVLFSCLVLYAA